MRPYAWALAVIVGCNIPWVARRLFGPLAWVIVSEWCIPDSALRWGLLTQGRRYYLTPDRNGHHSGHIYGDGKKWPIQG